MDLPTLMRNAGLGQRELARLVGYDSNGMVSKVIKGTAYVPGDDIPKWADALKLHGAEREEFLAWCAQKAIPDWILADLAQLRQDVRDRDAILGTGTPAEPTAQDLALAHGDQPTARRLALWRRAQRHCQERIAELEAAAAKPPAKAKAPAQDRRTPR